MAQTMYKIHHLKTDIDGLHIKGKKEEVSCYKMKLHRTRVSQHYRISEHKIWRRNFCNYCWKPQKLSTKHELSRYESRKCCSRTKPIKWNEGHNKGRHATHKSKIKRVLKKWESKVMYGQYIRSRDRQLINEKSTILWLSRRDVKAETECEIIATRDQALQTKYRTKNY